MLTKRASKWLVVASLVLLIALIQGACQSTLLSPSPAEPTKTPSPERILFIGDSFTFWNFGIDQHIRGLATSANPPLEIDTFSRTVGMAPLEMIWQYGDALDDIREGNWDVVVLQEDLAMGTDEQKFYEYARKFDEEIQKIGAQTVLYMTWEYDRENETITTEDIAQVYGNIGTELGAKVAPVGLAWKRATQERSDLDLYDSDRVHPNIHGTYLATSVLYATLFGQSPEGLSYLPPDLFPDKSLLKKLELKKLEVSADNAAFLQRIAWETVEEYQLEE